MKMRFFPLKINFMTPIPFVQTCQQLISSHRECVRLCENLNIEYITMVNILFGILHSKFLSVVWKMHKIRI